MKQLPYEPDNALRIALKSERIIKAIGSKKIEAIYFTDSLINIVLKDEEVNG